VIERQPDGKMRVTSGSWDGEKVFLKDQVLEVSTLFPTPGSTSLAKPRRRTTGTHPMSDPKVMWLQDRLTPVWKRLGGGCHLNRAIGTLIEEAGFPFDRLETGYMRGPKPMTFMYEGSARP
jgi:hypothetical protein